MELNVQFLKKSHYNIYIALYSEINVGTLNDKPFPVGKPFLKPFSLSVQETPWQTS